MSRFCPVRSSGEFDARAGISPIQYFLCSVGRSSMGLAARAGLCECRSSGELDAQAGDLAAKVLGVCIRRSSRGLAARAGVCECRSSGEFDTRAGRLLYKSEIRLLDHFFKIFSLSYFSKNTIVEPLTLVLYLLSRFRSSRSDLLIFGLYKKSC